MYTHSYSGDRKSCHTDDAFIYVSIDRESGTLCVYVYIYIYVCIYIYIYHCSQSYG